MKRPLALMLLASLLLACQNPFSADEKSTLRTGSFELRMGEAYSFTDALEYPDIRLESDDRSYYSENLAVFYLQLHGTLRIDKTDAFVAPYADYRKSQGFIATISRGDSTFSAISPPLPVSYFLITEDGLHFARITVNDFSFSWPNGPFVFTMGYIYQTKIGDHRLK